MDFNQEKTDSLSLDHLCLVDEICEQFETTWNSNSTEEIHAILNRAPEEIRDNLIREILVADIERRNDQDCLKPQSFYLNKFPTWHDEVQSAVQSVIDLGICLPDLRIGRYFVRTEIGKGGMGQVFWAVDPELKRDVAIKALLPSATANVDKLSRFQNEMTSLAKLAHPNIVTIFDVVRENGCSYAVMELLEGNDLAHEIRQKNIGHDRAIIIAEQIANGIAAAHDQRIIHRDIKPANVFLTKDGGVKVLDFGIARLKDENHSAEEAGITSPGQAIGTADYMSPEQLRGRDVDARSDIFSFGALLFEMIFGKKPFARKTVADTKAAILNDPIEFPEESNVPVEIKHLIERCLEKDAALRFDSMPELMQQLKMVQSQEGPTKKVGDTRNKWLTAALLSIVFAILIPFFPWFANSNSKIGLLAVLPFSGDIEELYIKDGLTFSLTNSLSKVEGLDVRPFAFVREAYGQNGPENTVDELSKILDVEAVVSGYVNQVSKENVLINVEIVDLRKNRSIWGKEYELPISEVLSAQNEILRDVAEQLTMPGQQDDVAENKMTTNLAAYEQFIHGQIELSRRQPDSVKMALECFQRAVSIDAEFEEAYVGLANCFIVQAERSVMLPKAGFEMARQYANEALKINSDSTDAKISLAMIAFEYDWDFEEAERRFRQALPRRLTRSEVKHPTGHQWFAEFLSATGRTAEALEQIKIAKKQAPKSDIIKTIEGLIYLKAGQFDQAIGLLIDVLDVNPNFDRARGYLIDAFELSGQIDRALIQWTALAKSDQYAVDKLKNQYKETGDSGYWNERLQSEEALSKIRSVSPLFLSIVHTKNGDEESALKLIKEAVPKRDGAVAANLFVHPIFDELREHEEFKNCLRRVGFNSTIKKNMDPRQPKSAK